MKKFCKKFLAALLASAVAVTALIVPTTATYAAQDLMHDHVHEYDHTDVLTETGNVTESAVAVTTAISDEAESSAPVYNATVCKEHTPGNIVTTKPTIGKTGVLTIVCTSCKTILQTVTLPPMTKGMYTSEITEEATCTREGVRTYTLNDTTYGIVRFTVSISARGHNYTTYKVTKNPTGAAVGTLTGTCSECSGTTTIEIPVLSYDNYAVTIVLQPTCTAKGLSKWKWNTTTYGTYTFEAEILALGHSYTTQVGPKPTLETAGALSYTCTRCNVKGQVALPVLSTTGAYTVSTITPATCIADGVDRYTWKTTTYGTHYFDVVTKGEHVVPEYDFGWEPTTTTTGRWSGYCTVCSLLQTVYLPVITPEEYTWRSVTSPTCTTTGRGFWIWNNTTYGQVAVPVTLEPLGHDYTYTVTNEPTATAAGSMRQDCTRCKDTLFIGLPKLTYNDYYVTILREPTCYQEGLSRWTWKNTTYGMYAFEVAIQKNHTYKNYAVTVRPTDTDEGKLIGTCACGETHVVTLPSLRDSAYEREYTAPTCTESGVSRYTWNVTTYGHITITVVHEPKGHSYSSYPIKTKPTKTASGLIQSICTRCDYVLNVEMPKLDAEHYTIFDYNTGTCIKRGTWRYTWNVTAYGTQHVYVEKDTYGPHSVWYRVTTEPTLTAAGSITGTCSLCDLAPDVVTLPKLNKTDYEFSASVEPTCTKTGRGNYKWLKSDSYQNAAGGAFVFYTDIPALGHDYTYNVTTAPTVIATGVVTGTCTRCEETTQITLPRLNTTDYTYHIAREASCTQTGLSIYTLKDTAYGKLQFSLPIVKRPHNYTKKVTPPTCTAQGYTTHTCTACGDTFVDMYVDMLPHTLKNGYCTVCGNMGKKTASGWSGDLSWVLVEDGTMIFSGEGKMKNYTHKSEMPWYSYFSQIKTVVLEPGVTSIGNYAFYAAPVLETIIIPDTVTTIGDYAFKNAPKLKNVTLPKYLSTLGDSAFYACTSLTSIEIPASLWTIKPYTFKNCTNLTSVKFNEGNLQKISDGAFYGTGLTSLVLPDCLDILDVYAFKGCTKLASITIGKGLTELREAVFYGTAISTITIPEGITKIGPYVFKNCTKLETISLPSTLTSIGEAAFYDCAKLKAITLPDKVKTIGNYAFRRCVGLTDVHFGTGLTTIGESSFYGCTGLTVLVIPDSVVTINPYAFKACTGLTYVTLGSGLQTIGESAFNTCTGLKTMIIPASVTTIGDYCFSGSYNLWKLTFQGDAPAIGTGAFKGMVATAYYPAGAAWASANMLNYGGTITWKAQ